MPSILTPVRGRSRRCCSAPKPVPKSSSAALSRAGRAPQRSGHVVQRHRRGDLDREALRRLTSQSASSFFGKAACPGACGRGRRVRLSLAVSRDLICSRRPRGTRESSVSFGKYWRRRQLSFSLLPGPAGVAGLDPDARGSARPTALTRPSRPASLRTAISGQQPGRANKPGPLRHARGFSALHGVRSALGFSSIWC